MALKTYSITAETPEQIEAMEFVVRSFIIQGKNLNDALFGFAQDYYDKNKNKVPFTMVSEAELLRIAQAEGLTTGKSSVVQYRRKGVLKDESGNWFYQNDQRKLVYNLEKMLEFLRLRHDHPKSHIKKNMALPE